MSLVCKRRKSALMYLVKSSALSMENLYDKENNLKNKTLGCSLYVGKILRTMLTDK